MNIRLNKVTEGVADLMGPCAEEVWRICDDYRSKKGKVKKDDLVFPEGVNAAIKRYEGLTFEEVCILLAELSDLINVRISMQRQNLPEPINATICVMYNKYTALALIYEGMSRKGFPKV